MKLREKWNTFKTNVKDLKKEDLRKFLPKVDLKVNVDNLKGNVLLLFQEKLDNNVILFTLEHMVMTGQVDSITFLRYAVDKRLDAETYAKIRNYRKHGYHLLNPDVVPINNQKEPPKLKFMITDKAQFEHREASKKAAVLQRLYGNKERKYSFTYLRYDVSSLNGVIDKLRRDDREPTDREVLNYTNRLLDVIERVLAFGYYLECNGHELTLHESKPASACVAQW